jgi:hypothetical protein
MWEDGGYELYESRESQWVKYSVRDEIGALLVTVRLSPAVT